LSRAPLDAEGLLHEIADGDLTRLDELVHESSRAHEVAGLDPEAFGIAQIAALAAVDASPTSWFVYFDTLESRVEIEKIAGALVALTPIVGIPRVVSAATNIISAAGLVDELDDETT
jgi:hypothetical protein